MVPLGKPVQNSSSFANALVGSYDPYNKKIVPAAPVAPIRLSLLEMNLALIPEGEAAHIKQISAIYEKQSIYIYIDYIYIYITR